MGRRIGLGRPTFPRYPAGQNVSAAMRFDGSMLKGTHQIRFEPAGKTVEADEGENLVEVAARAGIVLDNPCGGHGSCGKCVVRLDPAPERQTLAERTLLDAGDRDKGIRLTCQTEIEGSLVVEVPERSLLAKTHQILEHIEEQAEVSTDPPVAKRAVALSAPTLGDSLPDLDRLRKVLGPLDADIDLLRELPARLRGSDFQGTAVVADGHLIDFEPRENGSECFIAAFDIGTTTLVGILCELVSGRTSASTSCMNPQTAFGDDILTRISYAGEGPEGLDCLQAKVVSAINEMLSDLAAQAGISVDQIYEVTSAGNTTMQHLLAHLDPAALGRVPFTPTLSDALHLDAADLGIRIHPKGRAYVLPVIDGFVGGDTVAGILATRLAETTEPTMLVDIGTNGEIVLRAGGSSLATSCAAGPAFEGARIGDGMRAAAGAIEAARLDDDVNLMVIGGGQPAGLCGSALIDLLAELLRKGILMRDGLLLRPDDLPEHVPAPLRKRLAVLENGVGFTVATAEETRDGRPVILHQRDIRELQLATGAIRAGINTILKRMDLVPQDLDCLIVGGAFGNYIRCENAQRIGLLPAELDPDRIVFAGNTTLAGARQIASSQKARDLANNLARQTCHVDLSMDPVFQEAFMEAMFFPLANGK